MSNSLVKLEKAEQLLAEARTLDDLRQIRDIAVAAQSYAKAAHLGMDSQNRAAEVRLLAERKAGELLAEMKENGARKSAGGDQKSKSKNGILKLTDMGVTPKESSKWQSLAELPETVFREALETGKQERLTDATLQNAVKEHRAVQKKAKKQNELAAKADAFMLQETPPAPSLIRMINEDARSLSQFVTMDIDLVFTSPPYNVGMDYHTHNDRMSPADYRALLIDVFRECFKVMKPGARIGVNVPFGVDRDPYRPMAPQIFDALTACGFTLIGQTIWDKGQQAIANSTAWGSYASPSAPRFRDRCEVIVWGYKILPALEIPKGANLLIDGDTFRTLAQDYWHVPPASNPNHPAVFPPALAENAIRFFGFEGCHVLDPFAGIGNVGIAAKKLNCRASLVEIDAAYCAIAQEEINKQ